MERFYPESRLGGFTDLDGTIRFYTRLHALLKPDGVVVDFGCGRGAYGEDPVRVRRELRILRGKAGRVVGLDADPGAAENPYIDEFHRLDGLEWPVAGESADLVLADQVLEHLERPECFFAEARRVLRPGGAICIRTPNAWSYVALLSRLIPNRQHAGLLEKVKPGAQARDIFPTYYRCNSLPALRKALERNGFEGVVYGVEAEPSYLGFSKAAYALGVLHQKLAPGFLRAALFAFGRRRQLASGG